MPNASLRILLTAFMEPICPADALRLLVPSSQAALRPPGPLRTGREGFPSPSSSPSNASGEETRFRNGKTLTMNPEDRWAQRARTTWWTCENFPLSLEAQRDDSPDQPSSPHSSTKHFLCQAGSRNMHTQLPANSKVRQHIYRSRHAVSTV